MSIQPIRTLICSALLCTVFSAYAQFNIKVGYNGNYANLEKTADIINRYSANFPNKSQVLKPIRIYHGIEIGTRYKFNENLGFDFGISSAKGKSEVTGLFSLSSELIETEWKSSLNSLYIGLESLFESYGFGATIGYQQLTYKNKPNLNSDNIEILKQRALNSRFNLIFEFTSLQNAFSFRPFVSINWQPYNVYNVELALFPDSQLPASDFNEELMVFGISLLIYNGPQ
jgi:hypothetical protein